jgi:VanZ family protein
MTRIKYPPTGLVLWATLTFYALVLPPAWLGDIPWQKFDKIAHMGLFGLGMFMAQDLLSKGKALTLMLTIAILSEWLQELSPQRTFSVQDMGANILGIIMVLIILPKGRLGFDKCGQNNNN